jgi:hypothetical protein
VSRRREGQDVGMNERKPGVVLSTVVALVFLAAYPLSLAPAVWLTHRGHIKHSTAARIYRPVLLLSRYGPHQIWEMTDWCGSLFLPPDADCMLAVEMEKGHYLQFSFYGEEQRRFWNQSNPL